MWVVAATVLAGIISGFLAGASLTPTGGNASMAVAAFAVGLLGGIAKAGVMSNDQAEDLAKMAVVFLLCLIGSYISANVLRKHSALEWMGLGGPDR